MIMYFAHIKTSNFRGVGNDMQKPDGHDLLVFSNGKWKTLQNGIGNLKPLVKYIDG